MLITPDDINAFIISFKLSRGNNLNQYGVIRSELEYIYKIKII